MGRQNTLVCTFNHLMECAVDAHIMDYNDIFSMGVKYGNDKSWALNEIHTRMKAKQGDNALTRQQYGRVVDALNQFRREVMKND